MHFSSHINPQGWLPPSYLSVVVAGSAIHNYTPQTADSIEKRLSAYTLQGQAPGQSEDEGAAGELKKKWGAGISSVLTAEWHNIIS